MTPNSLAGFATKPTTKELMGTIHKQLHKHSLHGEEE